MPQLAVEPFFAPAEFASGNPHAREVIRADAENEKYQKRAFIISILAHASMLGLLVMFGVKQISPVTPTVAPVQARLYFPPPITLPKPAETVTQSANAMLQEQPQSIEPTRDSYPPNTSSQENAAPLPQAIEATSNQATKSEILTSENSKRTINEEFTKQQSSSSPKSLPLGLSRQHLNRYFERYNQQQLQDEATDAASDFRQQRISPTLPTYSQKRTTALDQAEAEWEIDTIKADCSSGAGKTFSLLSTLTGGTIECTQRGEHVQKYIDKRLGEH